MTSARNILKSVRINFDLSENSIRVKLGEKLNLESNHAMEHLTALFGALSVADGDIAEGLKTCLKGGAVVASMGVAAVLLKDAYNWLTPRSVQNGNKLELCFPESRGKNFEQKIKNLNLKEDFTNLNSRLEEILGEKYEKIGPEVLDTIGNIFVESVEPLSGEQRISCDKYFNQATDVTMTDNNVVLNIRPTGAPGIVAGCVFNGGSGFKFERNGGEVNIGGNID